MAVTTAVYALRGTGSTVQAYPSQIHAGGDTSTVRRFAANRRHYWPEPPPRRNDDDLVLALLGAL